MRLVLSFASFFVSLAVFAQATPVDAPPPGKLEVVPTPETIASERAAGLTDTLPYTWFALDERFVAPVKSVRQPEIEATLDVWSRSADAKLLLVMGRTADCARAVLPPEAHGVVQRVGDALKAVGAAQGLRLRRVGVAEACNERATARALMGAGQSAWPTSPTFPTSAPLPANVEDLRNTLETLAQRASPKEELTLLVASPAVVATLLKALQTRNRPVSVGSVLPEGVYALRASDGGWQVMTAWPWSRVLAR